jgi:hypothetical protein
MNLSMESKLRLLCEGFIQEHKITCADSIYQRDKMYEEAPVLLQKICDLVGYHKQDEDAEESES